MAGDRAALDEARARLVEHVLAPSSKAPKANKLELAEAIARRAGHDVLYPLTPDVILDVAAALSNVEYASGHSYLLEMRSGRQGIGL